MAEAPRNVKSVANDQTSVSYLSPAEQAAEDRRQAERSGLKRTKRLANFFRIFKVNVQDRP